MPGPRWMWFCAGLLLGVWGMAAQAAAIDDNLDQLAAAAAKVGSVIWYESSPDEQAEQIVAAFNRHFPAVKIEHVRDTGGNSIGARIIQESQGSVRTADIATTGWSILTPLIARNLAMQVDWKSLGAAPDLVAPPYGISTTAVIYIIVYNTALVPAADAPKNWMDLLNPRWDGKIGLWIRAEGEAALAASWGEDKVADYIKKLNALHPVLEKSTFPLAQQVAAGELLVGFGIYHTAQPPLRRGAPIKVVVPDPAPVDTLFSFVPAPAQNSRRRQAGGVVARHARRRQGL